MSGCCLRRGVWSAVAIVLLSISAGVAADEPQPRLTLGQAIRSASSRSPVLQAQRAIVDQAASRVVTAHTYPHDPEIILEGARREGPIESDFDHEIRIAQVIQTGGKRRRLVDQASAEFSAASSMLERQERLLAAQVAAAFVESLRARELLEVEQANAELARSLAEVADKRFKAGSVSRMEVNLARVQLGRAERDLRLSNGEYEVARATLAEVVGLDPAVPPIPLGELALLAEPDTTAQNFADTAIERRADLEAFRTAIEAARARIEVARKAVVPDLVLEAFGGKEEGTDRLLGAAIGIRIPLFNRNAGPIAEARAAERQAIADTEVAALRVRREVATARARYSAAADAARGLQQQVLGTLYENLRLLQRSFESGKTSWTEVLVFRREFVDIQRDYIATISDARLAAIELDLAAGTGPTTSSEEPQP